MLKVFTYFFVLIFVEQSFAQDIHFSQFNENPSLVNPALTGALGYIRASATSKQQWRSVTTPYSTVGASLDFKTSRGKRKRAGKFGYANSRSISKLAAGVAAYNDKSGDGKLTTGQLNISLATFVSTGKRSFLSLGVQGSLIQKKIDQGTLIFPNQYGGRGYDPNMNSGEEFSTLSYKYADYAAGALWSYGEDQKTFLTYHEIKGALGVSAYHLTQPEQKFLNATADVMQMKYVVHGNLLFTLPMDKTALAPSFIYQVQGAATEMIGGVMFKYYTDNDTKYTGYVKRTGIGLGAYYRSGDAAIFNFLLELQEQYAIGFSYDINISDLSKASHTRGGMEITLRYASANSFLYQKR